jgi:hypothetical protein
MLYYGGLVVAEALYRWCPVCQIEGSYILYRVSELFFTSARMSEAIGLVRH